jgi:MFS family permease
MSDAKSAEIPALICTPGFLRLAGAVFLFNAGYSIYNFLFNFFLASEGWREDRMGALTGAAVLGGLLGALPVARAANRWGSSRAMAGFLLACSLLLGLRLLPSPFAVQWALAALSGVFLCGWTVLAFPLIAAVAPEEQRGSAFQLLYGLATGAGCVGAVVGGSLPGWTMRLLHGVNETGAQRLSLTAAAGLICLSTLALPRVGRGERVETAARIRPTKRLAGLLAVSALWALLLGAVNPFSGIYFANQFHMELPAIGGYFFVVQAVVAAGLMLAGASRLSRWPAWMLFVAMQLAVAMAFAGMATHGLWMAEAAYLAFMLAQQVSQPALQSMLLGNASATERNQIAAGNTMLMAVAQAVAAQFFGLLWGHWGYAAVLPLLALATALAAAGSGVVLRASESKTACL